MTQETDFFHGAAISRLICASPTGVAIAQFGSSGAAYLINNSIGLYIKYSTKRMSPWRFTFLKSHQNEISELKSKYSEIFVILVCETDGIATLSHEDLKQILDSEYKESEWISATRKKREMYRIKGSDGELEFKIGDSDFEKKIMDALRLPR